MTLLSTNYNEEYFKTGYYCRRWYRNSSEFYLDRAKKLFDLYNLEGKKVLDIGCGLGYLVNDLRGMGVLADGIDFSEYSVSASKSPYVVLADARTYVKELKINEYDLIVMCEFLDCLPEEDLAQFIQDVDKKAKNFFIIERRDFSDEVIDLYNPKLLIEWQTYFPEVEIIWREEESKWQSK